MCHSQKFLGPVTLRIQSRPTIRAPERIKQGTGASAYYLQRTTQYSSWQNCTEADGAGQDATCVVPYRYAAAASLATITASFTKPNPVVGGTGTALIWTTTNAVGVSVTCTGVATYGPATVPVQGNPSGIVLNSATTGAVTCVYTALNIDGEPATTSVTATFVNPTPPTISASFSKPNPWLVVDKTSPIWSSANASKVHVTCTGINWGPGYVTLQSNLAPVVQFGASNTGAGTISCTFTATNEIGQTAQATATATFAPVPPPTANAWFNPSAIMQGESSSFNWVTSGNVYAGIVCGGVEVNYAGVTTPNQAWYWNPITFPNAGEQQCGIQSINAAGASTFVNATLYIYPTGGGLGGSASSTTTNSTPQTCMCTCEFDQNGFEMMGSCGYTPDAATTDGNDGDGDGDGF